jgi:orotate phosphoribosyltransferase
MESWQTLTRDQREDLVRKTRENAKLDPIFSRAEMILRDSGALLVGGHYKNKNRHSSTHINTHEIFCVPSLNWLLIQDLIDIIPLAILDQVETIVGPESGGAHMALAMAGIISSERKKTKSVNFAQLTKTGDPAHPYYLTPTYKKEVRGKKVLVVDDVLGTGSTIKSVLSGLQQVGSEILALGFYADRGYSVRDWDYPEFCLYKAPSTISFPEDKCPMCNDGIPISEF